MREFIVLVCFVGLCCGIVAAARYVGAGAAKVQMDERDRREAELKEWAKKEKMDRENAAANAK